jgi:hypothetical protein
MNNTRCVCVCSMEWRQHLRGSTRNERKRNYIQQESRPLVPTHSAILFQSDIPHLFTAFRSCWLSSCVHRVNFFFASKESWGPSSDPPPGARRGILMRWSSPVTGNGERLLLSCIMTKRSMINAKYTSRYSL